MIAPFVRMFCLARKTFEGVSETFLIVDFLALPFTIMFAMFPRKETIFLVFPLPSISFVFLFPIFTTLAWPCLPVSFRFFGFLYLPPEAFLPCFMVGEENFVLNKFGLYIFLLDLKI